MNAPRPRKPVVRPSLPPWKQVMFHFSPITDQVAGQFDRRIQSERDLRIFCMFGMPGPLPVGRCTNPVLADGFVYSASQLREQYLDPFCPDANMVHSTTLLADAVLLRARRTPVTERQLRDMAPMMAQAAIEPFAVDVDDPARVMVKAADHLAESGLLARGTGQGGVKTYALTDLGRVRVEDHVRAKWWPAVN